MLGIYIYYIFLKFFWVREIVQQTGIYSEQGVCLSCVNLGWIPGTPYGPLRPARNACQNYSQSGLYPWYH